MREGVLLEILISATLGEIDMRISHKKEDGEINQQLTIISIMKF